MDRPDIERLEKAIAAIYLAVPDEPVAKDISGILKGAHRWITHLELENTILLAQRAGSKAANTILRAQLAEATGLLSEIVDNDAAATIHSLSAQLAASEAALKRLRESVNGYLVALNPDKPKARSAMFREAGLPDED